MRDDHSVNVALVRWPAEEDRRPQIQSANQPCIWVVEAGADPPVCESDLEDWVRPPVIQPDLDARAEALRRRVETSSRPVLDEDGQLIMGRQSIILSRTQQQIMQVLMRSFSAVTPADDILRHTWPDDEKPPTTNALHLQVFRLRKRLQPLGLSIRTAWGNGYVLCHADDDLPEQPDADHAQSRTSSRLAKT